MRFLSILIARFFLAASALFAGAFAFAADGPFRFDVENDRDVVLYDGAAPIWRYAVARRVVDEAIPTDDPRRIAASFFHPLYGLGGETLTACATLDDNHAHHRGLWSSFTTVILRRPDGSEELYDAWTDNTPLKKDFARASVAAGLAESNAPIRLESDENRAEATFENVWRIGDDEEILRETLVATAGRLETDPEFGRFRVLTFAWRWTPTAGNVVLAGDRAMNKNFSSLAIRFARPKKTPSIFSDRGELTGDDMLGANAWLDYRSNFAADGGVPAVGATTAGVAIFPDPSNPPYDGGTAIRHYGLVATGWPGLAGIEIARGETVGVRYRVALHENAWSVDETNRFREKIEKIDAAARPGCETSADAVK